jgi:hypothetical protein
VTDDAMWNQTVGGYTVKPEYQYPLRMFTVRDDLAFSDNLKSEPDYWATDSLYLSAVDHLIRYGSPMYRGTCTLALNTSYRAGQLVRIRNLRLGADQPLDAGQNYKTYRITDVTHSFSTDGAVTTINFVNDLINSTPRLYNEYSEAIRALSPKHQDKTMASLYTSGSWDNNSIIIPSRVKLPKVDY